MSRLRAQINNVMLRRRKDDVLDLPEKIYSTEYVEMSKKQSNIYAEILRELRENIDKIKLSPNPLVQMIRLRQATGYTGILSTKVKESAKLERLEEMIEDVVDSGEKCLVFSNWTDITDECEKRLKKYNPAVITGKTKDREKQVQEDKFKQEDDCKVLIGTTGAMGTGLTFTNATRVFFVDEPWNKATR
ncbi:MAG: ATP-dependent helicase, partial [Bacteroidales bacterium]|nr:ATP-dependent helicase [Bacteroidales bacterium]